MLIALLVAAQATPVVVPHQGRLLNASGTPYNGQYSLTFSLMDGATSVWSDTYDVPVQDGMYTVQLGEDASPVLDSAMFAKAGLTLRITSGALLFGEQPIGTVPVAAVAQDLAGTGGLDLLRIRFDAGEGGRLGLRYHGDGWIDGFVDPATIDGAQTTMLHEGDLWTSASAIVKQAPSTTTTDWNYGHIWTFTAGAPGTTNVAKGGTSYEHAAYYKTSLGTDYVRWGYTDDGTSNTEPTWRQWGLVSSLATSVYSGNTIHARSDFSAGTAFYATWQGAGTNITMYFFKGGAASNAAGIGTTNRDTGGSSGGSAVVTIQAGDEIWIERDPDAGNAVRFYIGDTMVHEFADHPSFALYGYMAHGYPNTTPRPAFNGTYYATAFGGVPATSTLTSTAHTLAASPTGARVVVLLSEPTPVTLGTDFFVDVSRDDGTTWIPTTLTSLGAYDPTSRLVEATATFSGPAGTALRYRLRTANSVDVDIRSVLAEPN